MRALSTLIAALIEISIHPAGAMQFTNVNDGSNAVIIGQGPIVEGDVERFRAAVNGVPNGLSFVGLALDSPGGELVVAETLAAMVQRAQITVAILDHSTCASACFLVFAASPHRMAAGDALIGIHSASVDGQENLSALGATTVMARDLAAFGVPDAILGRLVTTRADRMNWLLPEELRSLSVTMLAPSVPQRPNPPPAARAPVGPPVASSQAIAPAAPAGRGGYGEGLADRQRWESWFDSQTGEFRAGVEYWAANRSYPSSFGCNGPGWSPARVSGCTTARQALVPLDARRRTEPDYRAGWNTIP